MNVRISNLNAGSLSNLVKSNFGVTLNEAKELIEDELSKFASVLPECCNVEQLTAEQIALMHVLGVAIKKREERNKELIAKIDIAKLLVNLERAGYTYSGMDSLEKVAEISGTSVKISITLRKDGVSYRFDFNDKEVTGEVPLAVLAKSSNIELDAFLYREAVNEVCKSRADN